MKISIKKNYIQFLLRSGLLIVCLQCILGTYASASAQVSISIGVHQNYVPPQWAPPYDNVSTTRYYYFPDQDMYYDVWERQFYYMDNGVWIATSDVPPMYAGIDLNTSFIVLINRNINRPWENHEFYRDNYPSHGYDHYREIAVNNRIVTNIQPGHELVPRAYNESNRRVTFMQHPTAAPTPQYHHVVHEVPMRSIAPSMPKESRGYNYGGASNRPARNAAPARAANPGNSNGNQGRGNQGNGNQGKGNQGNGNQGNGNGHGSGNGQGGKH
jgi:hypothetical protein